MNPNSPKLNYVRVGTSRELIVIGVFMAPIPVSSLLAALVLAKGHFVFGMFLPEGLVGFRFAIIPVVIVLVVAIVDPDADRLRSGVGGDGHRSNQRGA